ncbi:hypothetical protein NCCP2716_21040 [Sporosarcina sp. NCCP-2716]|uniref:DUF6509 family protein n=1 Tax=Sporosarcina sp. NCCP-2716 TaxID=2943679 RepID=UPI00203CC427|nr:DUF6509 family protein [Sporosarcina sp. NCCP-2716]GKV69606.1 hypothetical protein NCCP2716_21040 [Sporosarcina sp. NCCP-2716]
MEIKQYTKTELIDPTGILDGRRYEFFLFIDFDEEDELAEEEAGGIRTVYIQEEGRSRITGTYFFKKETEEALDFELEEEEEAAVLAFCGNHADDTADLSQPEG